MRSALSRTSQCRFALLGAAVLFALPAVGQISLPTAVNLALQNSPKVKIAEVDLYKAKAVLAESKETFVPAVSTTGGVGKSTGAPLSPPVVFSIAAQSLVYQAGQRDYIRAAHSGISSAELALDAARTDVVEDTTTTYVTLDNALQRKAVQTQALDLANRLVTIAQQRYDAGVDAHVELTKAKRTAAQIRLQQLSVEDEIATQTEHLARLTGLPFGGLTPDHGSIPVFRVPELVAQTDAAESKQMGGISAAFAAAQAKAYTAHGDRRYLLRPQVMFSANYSRISTAFTTYTQYYPRFGAEGNSFNSLNLGVQITLPLLDMVHRAKARQSAADAAHSLYEAQLQQGQFLESRSKLHHSALELAARSDLASLDRDLAQDQLDAVLIRLQASAGAGQGEQLTPKDAENARLQERQRTLDKLNADLQLQQTEILLLRQEGSLASWLAATIPSAIGSPSRGIAAPAIPATIGTEPSGPPRPGSAPSSVPTTGTTPSTLPSAPVNLPSPTNPPSAPSPHPPGTR